MVVDPVNAPVCDVLSSAENWLGTPYVLGAALRGVGCDCVGLIRGVWGDLRGVTPPPSPPWREDWVNSSARPLVAAARQYLTPIRVSSSGPGCVVVLRVQGNREAHCGIICEGNTFIHAVEGVGVVRVPFDSYLPNIAFAARF